MDAHATRELIQATAATAAIARLAHLHLAKRFPAILVYLVFVAGTHLGFGLLKTGSVLYFWSYVAVQPLKCVLSIIAVRELFDLIFTNYPGIRTVGRWVMYVGVALALSVSLFLTGFFWSGGARGRAHSHVYYFEISQRSIVFALAIVIVLILASVSKYPLHLDSNTLISGAFFSVLFLSEASQLLIDSLAPRLYNLYVDWSESFFVSACLIAWASMLAPERETAPAQIRFSSPREDHLLQQLKVLNQTMTRSIRR
jgi:hypothetical protein